MVLVAAAMVLALVLSGAALAYSIRSGRRLGDELRMRSFLSAQAFARAAAMWLDLGDRDTLSRVADLMLSGSSLYVQIVSDGTAVIDRARPDSGIASPPVSSFVEGAAHRIASGSESGTSLVDVLILLQDEEESASDSYVRVGFDASLYVGRAVAEDLRIALIGAALWILPVGLVLALRVWLRPPETRDMLSPARDHPGSDEVLTRGPLFMDLAAKEVRFDAAPVSLTPKLFDLLFLLASAENRVFSEAEIITAVWTDSPYADSTDVRQGIRRLRQRLRSAYPGAEWLITNVKGFGYRFESAPLGREGRPQDKIDGERSGG